MTNRRDGSLEKAARLITLRELRSNGQLDGLSLQKIADMFQQPPHRSTIMRDLRDLDRLEDVLREIKEEQGRDKGQGLTSYAIEPIEPEDIKIVNDEARFQIALFSHLKKE